MRASIAAASACFQWSSNILSIEISTPLIAGLSGPSSTSRLAVGAGLGEFAASQLGANVGQEHAQQRVVERMGLFGANPLHQRLQQFGRFFRSAGFQLQLGQQQLRFEHLPRQRLARLGVLALGRQAHAQLLFGLGPLGGEPLAILLAGRLGFGRQIEPPVRLSGQKHRRRDSAASAD